VIRGKGGRVTCGKERKRGAGPCMEIEFKRKDRKERARVEVMGYSLAKQNPGNMYVAEWRVWCGRLVRWIRFVFVIPAQ
jgi:hypothetical protein